MKKKRICSDGGSQELTRFNCRIIIYGPEYPERAIIP